MEAHELKVTSVVGFVVGGEVSWGQGAFATEAGEVNGAAGGTGGFGGEMNSLHVEELVLVLSEFDVAEETEVRSLLGEFGTGFLWAWLCWGTRTTLSL